MLLNEEQELLEVLHRYVNGDISRQIFLGSFSQIIPKLESKLNGDLYPFLDVILPKEQGREHAKNEGMRQCYLEAIARLECALAEPSYYEKLSEDEQKEICKEAIEAIPKVALYRSISEWIQNNLIEGKNYSRFAFFDADGNSFLESFRILYEVPLICESFILTALAAGLSKPSFSYSGLIDSLKIAAHADTVWARCCECEGACWVEETGWYTDPRNEIENLQWIEYQGPSSTQWSPKHLVLVPEHKEWMLVHTNDFKKFSMILHGRQDFINAIVKQSTEA